MFTRGARITFINIITCSQVGIKSITRRTLTGVVSLRVDTDIRASSITDPTFILINTRSTINSKLIARITVAQKTAFSIKTPLITIVKVFAAFVYVQTVVVIKLETLIACTGERSWFVDTLLITTPIIPGTFIDIHTGVVIVG